MTVFEIDRICATVAGDAEILYGAEHQEPLTLDFVREEIGGLGDAAFINTSAQTMRAQLFLRRANTNINLQDYEAADAASVKACLTTLAADLLVAP